ncbi:uncharacterized protein LOC115552047 [Gadus morhua]|uniref:uncharacterized protein LOC115552047 n=1 Tax=Gadus morhua TaxID=8049 RepID=UPI0011B7DA08|nr:uncharacterized protein LOC115552047 [Gadus morhua]
MLNIGAVLLLLIGVTDGVKTFCNATQPHITTQCFGSLGGTVEVLLVLPTQSSQNDTFRLKNNNVTILSERNQTNIRYSFNVSTGIFTIKDIDRTDNDEYSMEVHNASGNQVAFTKCYLTIEAPASSPLLSRQCLSRGQQRVSCSAGGDGLHYSWSPDGLPLNDTRVHSGPGNASDVTLEVGWAGLVTCSVSNNVSHAAANITLSVCDGFIYVNCTSNGTHISQWVHGDNNTLCPEAAVTVGPTDDVNTTELVPIIAGSLSAIALLLIVVLGVYCAKKHKTSKDTTEAEDVTYADISVLQRQGQRREQGVPSEQPWYTGIHQVPSEQPWYTGIHQVLTEQPWYTGIHQVPSEQPWYTGIHLQSNINNQPQETRRAGS